MDIQASNENNNNNKNNLDNEMGAYEKFESELKNTIFGVLFVLLKEQEVSIYGSFLIAFIQFIQLLIFPFHETVYGVWNYPKVVKVINMVFNYLNIVPYLAGTSWNLYITFLYVGIAIIAIVIFDALFVNYAFSKRSFSFTWPLIILRYIAMFFVSIGFLPFLDYFVSVLACVTNRQTGVMVHTYFPEIECWTGSHILHAVFAIFAIILFIAISMVFSLTYFEYRSTSNDPTARVSSRANFFLLSYKMVMIICLTFLTASQFQVVLLALILVGSFVLFMKFYFNSPYHNEIVSKLWSIVTVLNFWTAIMLVFSKIMEHTLFEGSIIAWLLGFPLIISIMVTNKDHRVDLLLINANKVQHGREIQERIRYLLKLIEWQTNHRNSAILLDGYIEIHKQSCSKDDCPLKQKLVKNNRFTKNLMSEDDTLNEKYALVIQLLYRMYSNAIKKYPSNTSLRIAYAFFLLEKMQSKQQALQELAQVEQYKPPFDEQFIIYRYKKIIEDEIAESQNEGQGGLDVVSEIAFQNLLRQLQANIEKSALLHMEFWSQLSEDNPDLTKLNDIGSKINSSVHNVEEHWNKLLKININNTKAMRLYGKFLIEIINDREAGDDLLEKARNLGNVQNNKKIIQMIGKTGEDYNNDATPTVWVSGEQDKLGMITGINLAAASLFGYNKTELLNRKVNYLMPQVYGKYHDAFLENYLNAGEQSLIAKNKERLVFGKNKSNYVFPVNLSLRAVQSINQGIQFIATFRIEKNFKNAAHVLTQPDGTIDSLSSSAINLLKIDLKSITQKKANIQDFVPNIIDERLTMFSTNSNAGRASATVTFVHPRDSEYLYENEAQSSNLTCYLYELVYLGGREYGGYHFRFERIIDKSVLNTPGDKKAKISNFQFKFEKDQASIIGEYIEPSSGTEFQSRATEEEIYSGYQNTEQLMSEFAGAKDMMISSAKRSQGDDEERVKIDYGIGIKVLRLIGGRPQEIEEENRDGEEDEDGGDSFSSNQQSQGKQNQQASQQDGDMQEEGSYRDFSTTFKSRKALTSIVNDKTPPSSIRSLRWTANLLGAILLVIGLLNYILAISKFDAINTDITLLDESNIRLAEMMNALSKIRDLYLVNIGLLSDTYVEATLRADLAASLDLAKNIKQSLEQQTSILSAPHIALLNSPVIKLTSLDGTISYKGLTQATEEIISKAYNIVSLDLADITVDNNDYFYVTYNLMNDYYLGLKASSEYYAVELFEKVNEKGGDFLILLLSSIASLILALLILFPILFQVNRTREKVISLFLDIPEKTVRGLYNKCETFISNLQVGEDEEMISEVDEDELEKQTEDNGAQDFIQRRRRKRFKNSGRNHRSLYLQIIGVALVLEAYFIYVYIGENLLLKNISTLMPELNSTSVAEAYFSFSNNAERQLFIDSTFPIINSDSYTVSKNNIEAVYNLDSLILEEDSINRKIHSDDYANAFNGIMMADPCDSLAAMGYVATSICEDFADSTIIQGMTVALSRHFENMRTILSCYNQIATGSTCSIKPGIAIQVSSNSIENTILNLMRTDQEIEIDSTQHIYIKGSLRILMETFRRSVKQSFNNELTVRLIAFILFVILVLGVYIFLWQTLVRKLSNDVVYLER